MNIAITGSNGFLGKAICQKLKTLNHQIVEIDLVNGKDLIDNTTLSDITCFDVLIHFAAVSFVPDSFKNPVKY